MIKSMGTARPHNLWIGSYRCTGYFGFLQSRFRDGIVQGFLAHCHVRYGYGIVRGFESTAVLTPSDFELLTYLRPHGTLQNGCTVHTWLQAAQYLSTTYSYGITLLERMPQQR